MGIIRNVEVELQTAALNLQEAAKAEQIKMRTYVPCHVIFCARHVMHTAVKMQQPAFYEVIAGFKKATRPSTAPKLGAPPQRCDGVQEGHAWPCCKVLSEQLSCWGQSRSVAGAWELS